MLSKVTLQAAESWDAYSFSQGCKDFCKNFIFHMTVCVPGAQSVLLSLGGCVSIMSRGSWRRKLRQQHDV